MEGKTTRERLIEAARQCLLDYGHQACSVKRIARAAGVNHGLVHHYFGSKEHLWLAVVEREAGQMRAMLETAPERFMDDFFVPELLQHPDRPRLALELLALAKASPAVAEGLRVQFRLNRRLAQCHLCTNDESVATLAFAALFGLAIHAELDPALEVKPAVELLLALLAQRQPDATVTPAGRATGQPCGGAEPSSKGEAANGPAPIQPNRSKT